MKVYNNILELVGNTPLVEYKKLEEEFGAVAKVYGKLEFFNPSGSVKLRAAWNMVEEAEKAGKIKPGGTLLEGTSGNTGIALALVAAVKGYKLIITMPDNLSEERTKLLNAYGVKLIKTPHKGGMKAANEMAAKLHEEIPNSWICGQGENPDNPGGHEKTTGPEIWRDMDGKVDILVATSGTGGTISGTAAYLKSQNKDIKIIAVEPAGCPVLNGGEPGPHKIQGIGGGSIPPVTNREIFDEVIDVTDEDAYSLANKSAKKEGILIGISAGAALYAALTVAKRPENAGKNIVVIIPDSGERYLSSDLYD